MVDMDARKGKLSKGAIPKATRSTDPFGRSGRTARSPPSANTPVQTTNTTSGTADESMYQCEVCLITDKGDKVCCDSCNLWSHFACVNVTSDIVNHDWFCANCQQKRQPPLMDVTSEIGGVAANNNVPIVTNAQTIAPVVIPTVLDANQQLATEPASLDEVHVLAPSTRNSGHPNPARSHKSKSIASSTSSSSRRKALALKRLEEERQLQQLREQEERQRRDEERKQRELKDKEYLDKKYSILDQSSDESLSYDGYDETMHQERYENIRRWRAKVQPNTHTENPFVDLRGPESWDDVASGPSKTTPQMSSTNIFQAKRNHTLNPKDELVPIFEDIGDNDVITKPAVNDPVNVQEIPKYTINVQSTQPNVVTIRRGTRNVQSRSMSQTTETNTQPLRIVSPNIPTNQLGHSVSHNQVQSVLTSSNRQHANTPISIGWTPPVVLNNNQSKGQNVNVSSNAQLSSTVSATTTNQTLSYTTNVAAGIGTLVTPTNPTHNATFVVNGQPSASISSNGNQLLAASNQPLISSQAPAVTLHQQPIISSTHQSSLGHMPFVTTAVYQPYLSNPQPSNSMQFSASQSQHLSSMNYRSAPGNLLVSSQQQPVFAQAQMNSTNMSYLPASYYPPNQNFNSTGAMNSTYAPQQYPAAAAPNQQMIQSYVGVRQLTAEQIASRHVIPKDLPTFYGDPEDWVKFISAYENSTTVCGYSNNENIGRLQKAIKGDAEEAVRSLLVHADSVPEIIRTLHNLFGRPEIIIDKLITEIYKTPVPKEDDLASILKFAIKVKNLSHSIRNTGVVEHLRNPNLINSITDKLPTQMQLKWGYHKRSVGYTDLGVLGDWLGDIADTASLIVRRGTKTSSKKKEEQKEQSSAKSNSNSTKPNTYVNTQVETPPKKTEQQTTDKGKRCPACKNTSCVKLFTCNKFKEVNRSDRATIVRENKLCTRCLGDHHFFRCRSNLVCKVDGCKAKHHTLLHNYDKELDSQSTTKTGDKFSSNASHFNSTTSNRNNRIDIFRIVPITVFNKNRSVQIYAFFDEGSNMTTMESSLANELSLGGTSTPICVDWAFGYTHSVESKIVSLRIAGCFNEAEQYDLENVRTVKDLHLPTQSMTQDWIDQYSHLKGLPIATYKDVKPRMLIGLQYSRLTVSLRTVEGNSNEPLACQTRLGWVVQGPSYDTNDQMKRQYSMNICECQSNDLKLHQLVKEYFFNENLGVKIPDTLLESKDIQRARQIMESTTEKTNGRYETGLLWKSDKFELPDSYPMALKRLKCLESKLAKDHKLKENLHKQIQQFVVKGYIRKLNPEELKVSESVPVWYLPTFPAFNPKKPEKVRIVWDGAAKVRNVSLNSLLLPGPDQLVPLPDVLRKFRERRIGMLGDIAEMYHQVKVIQNHQHAQRFLWRDEDSSEKPDVYVMLVLPFGLTCSPSLAQFVKNKNAHEFVKQYPEAVDTIVNKHYVDDMLDSDHTVDAAERRINEVKFIHAQGGFHIRNFLSNSKELLLRIGEGTDQPSKNLNISVELGTERVLGMFWNTANDCFTFSLRFTKITEKILSGEKRPTKREFLRILMSIFDPLGLLANFLVYAKILLQEAWRSNVDWDEEVTLPIFKKWTAWIKTLPDVEKIEIPRLYSTKISPNLPKSIQLHIFVDASLEAYATAIYFRIEDDDGVDCCLVGAKTKVAPNKPMSVPRLELQGGVLGIRLANSIKSSQTLNFDKQICWTDSQDVMAWINSETRKYKQFVAFRVGEILESSEPNEWRWLPSEQNVADEATKSKIAKLNSSSRWYKAPKFLYDKEENWFKDESNVEYFTEEEARPSFSMACREIVRPALIETERFSLWNRLLRATAYVLRFVYNIGRKKADRRNGPLTQSELFNAENQLYRQAQYDHFMDDVLILKENRSSEDPKDLEKSSILSTYSPYLDDHDVIRMKGRIDAATAVSYDTKRPIILPRRHRITRLIVDHYHRRYKHINHSTALNEIRQKFVVPALRVVMKGIRSSCQRCKNLSAVPKIPEMAELPAARLAANSLPYTFVGIDYFGPFRVRNGRKTRNRPVIMEKRWVLLFTCLTTRAVWMEIAHSLDTNSCIMCIDNFILRKGQPREIHSDNGSSFHSSDKELIEEFKKMDQSALEEKFTTSNMVWKFNSPATPHMGGVWERLIRTVKSCLKQAIQTRTPNDEMFKNFIVEAEHIVNSRPLTYVSLESADDEALTPNHILLGSSNGIKPFCDVTDKDLARNTYKAVQVLANNFWRRFVLEYMPTLTKRTKWFKQVEPIKVGDVVVVVDETNERNSWPKGIVEELLAGKRGIVRQVMVRTAKGMRRRSVSKLAVLDVKPPSIDEVNGQSTASIHGEGNVEHCIDANTGFDEFIQRDCQMHKSD